MKKGAHGDCSRSSGYRAFCKGNATHSNTSDFGKSFACYFCRAESTVRDEGKATKI